MRPAARALLLGAFVTSAGCLPRGPAPAGRRWLDDGTAYGVQFVPGPAGSPGHLVTMKLTSSGPGPLSFYAVHEPAAGDALGTETFLTDNAGGSSIGGLCFGAPCPPAIDSQGRLFIKRDRTIASYDGGSETNDTSFVRADPATDAVLDLGSMSQLTGTFAQGTTFAYTVLDTLHVRGADDGDTQFDHVLYQPAVLNDALYFAVRSGTKAIGTLNRLTGPPFDSPEVLASDVISMRPFQAAAPALVLCRTVGGDPSCSNSLFDPVTLQETPLPKEAGDAWSISPSGRYLFLVRQPQSSTGAPPAPPSGGPTDGASDPPTDDQLTVSLFDRTLGTLQSTSLTELDATYWRPGRDELWFAGTPPGTASSSGAIGDSQAPLWRWVPGTDPAMVLAQQAVFMSLSSNGGQWPFTADGRFLLTHSTAAQTDKPTIILRAADDPGTELLTLNPAGTGVQDVRQLPDGRLIVSDWITDGNRADIYLVDGDAGTMTPLGHGGNVVATGATRILARLDWLTGGGSGDLSLIDLATGATTLVAENVHAVAVEAPASPGADPLAPGTRIAFISRNRVASPYDGLWIASLP